MTYPAAGQQGVLPSNGGNGNMYANINETVCVENPAEA